MKPYDELPQSYVQCVLPLVVITVATLLTPSLLERDNLMAIIINSWTILKRKTEKTFITDVLL